VANPQKATKGLWPNVVNKRLNQTTSGSCRRIALSSLAGLLTSLKDQQRSTENPSGSGSLPLTVSASTVRLRKEFRWSSLAIWNPYSLSPPRLGGNVVTRQIFMVLKPRA